MTFNSPPTSPDSTPNLAASGKVNASYTSPKYAKLKGARLGMVTIDRESVIVARPDDVATVCVDDAST